MTTKQLTLHHNGNSAVTAIQKTLEKIPWICPEMDGELQAKTEECD